MGFAIPKIEYKNVETTGNTTNGNGTISNIPSTTAIEVGMFVRGTGIPAGATVGSKGANSVTLASSVLATATGTGVAISFGYKVEFDYPPKEDRGEKRKSNAQVSTSLSGEKQVSLNHIEASRSPIFSFLSPSIYALLVDFLEDHGLYGRSFRYYEDKTLTPYTTYELAQLDFDPKKIAPRGVDTYVWEVALKFRRVL